MADPPPPGLPVRPTLAARVAGWVERTRILRSRVDELRARHSSLDLGLTVVERDSSIGGGLLAGALAYRLFVLLLPTALLFVSGLGLYSRAADESAAKVTRETGLQGLIASNVASAASGTGWLVFLAMLPAVAYALVKLYRAIAVTHAIVWHGSGRAAQRSSRGVALLGAAVVANAGASAVVGWARGDVGRAGGLAAFAVYVVVVGGAWLLVSMELPHGDVAWLGLLPGAVLVGAGLLCVNVFNAYVTSRIVENRANTYGALGIATALLFSLVLVGRLVVVSAELNASLEQRRTASR